jgi:hypothetical protein
VIKGMFWRPTKKEIIRVVGKKGMRVFMTREHESSDE